MANSEINLSSLNGSNGFTINGIDVDDGLGFAVSNAGDVNGDGVDDLIIGAPFADSSGSPTGDSYVVFGSRSPFSSDLEASSFNGSNGFIINGVITDNQSGFSVSSAGDVNGDGVDDLIIGARFANPNGRRSGESYVVFGSRNPFSSRLALLNLNGFNGFTINGINASDISGRSVSSAGDVNGDGIDDLIIGAYAADPNGNSSGESYVVFGSRSPFSSRLELFNLNGFNGFTINGINEDDQSGRSVSNAGDINGDGVDDLIIGARFADPNGSLSGQSYVVFGSRSPFNSSLELSNLNGSNGFIINGVNENDLSGISVSGAGDINGDGLDDLIIGAYLADPNGLGSGQSYVVFGSRSPFNSSLELSNLNGSNGFIINGVTTFDTSGISVSSAGDVNGDGLDDLIIGAGLADPNGSLSGESYVVFGSRSPFSSTLELSSLNGSNGFKLNGIDAYDRSGRFVSSAGDVNGDGLDDLIIGAYLADTNGNDSGESYVVFGNAAPKLDLNGDRIGFTINGINAGDFSGQSVSNAGDVNGDGIDDLIIGANEADPNGNRSGQSYIIFGSLNGFSSNFDLSSLSGINGFTINGINAGDNLGSSVSSAGDINGDGLDDLIIGARFADPNGDASGKSYVVLGSRTPFNSIFDLQSLNGNNGFSINGISTGDRSGSAVSNVGDVNGDGIDDLIIGAYTASPDGNVRAGESYVVFGSSTFSNTLELSSLNGNNGFKIDGVNESDTSGYSISGAGDINGDGINDFIIGARDAATNGIRSGESYVVFGSTNPFSSTLELSSLNGSNGFKIIGINEFDRSGGSVSSAGDVNGDGIDDLIIGAQFADSNGVVSGESYVVFGSTNPFSSTLELSNLNGSNGFAIIGIEAGDSVGSSVSNAGDVNGDGIDDLIIGAQSADANGFLSGESYVIFGSNTQFSSRLDLSDLNGSDGFVIKGIDAGDRSGGAVSSAGDINGDGIDDLTIGALGAEDYSGESYVIFGRSNLGAGGVLNLTQIRGLNNIDGIDFKTEFTGTPIVIVGNNLSLVDDNSASLIGATVTLRNPLDGAVEQLSANTTDTNIVARYDSSTGILTLSGSDSAANYQQVLRTITYDNSAPTGIERIIEFVVDDGESHSNTSALATTKLSFVLPPIAVNDNLETDEDTQLSGNVLDDNGNGPDSDPNGDPLEVTSVNGIKSNVGSEITLQSGALLVVNADGTFEYNPSGQFEFLSNGETNLDSFDYTISDGKGGTDTATFTINILGANELLDGTPQDDVLVGSNLADTIKGLEKNDFIRGRNGNDILNGNEGNDVINGGNGNDQIFGDQGDDDLMGGAGDDLIEGGTGDDTVTVNNFSGVDSFDGGAGKDLIKFDPTDGHNLTIFLKRGNVGDGRRGGQFFTNFEQIVTGSGDDRLLGDELANYLNGGAGNDELIGDLGRDTLIGGQGEDTLLGGDGKDFLFGDLGNDLIDGGTGSDQIFGGQGDDDLNGGVGDDMIDGGDGDDTVTVTDFGDVDFLDGGAGNDLIRFDPMDGRNLTIFLKRGNVGDGATGAQIFSNFEQFITGRGNDRLFGDELANSLNGGAGNDELDGDAGRDTLIGGQGEDTLLGGIGDDILIGNQGADSFLFEQDLLDGQSDTDTIQNFQSEDILDFSAYLLGGGSIEISRVTAEFLRIELSSEDTVNIFGSSSALDIAETQI